MSQCLFFRAVSQEAEVTEAHEAIGQDMKQEAADKLLGIQSHRLFSIPVFSISVAQGDLLVLDLENTLVRERHTVGVAAQVVKDGVG